MKILHIIDSGGLYGAEVMLLNLVGEQMKMGIDSTICSIGEKGIDEKPIETEAVKRGIKIKIFRMSPGPNILGAFKILRFAKKERFDLLHSHGYKGNVMLGFIPKSIRKIPLITTLHGWTSASKSGFSKMKLYEWLDMQSLKRIDKVVIVNKLMLLNPKIKVANIRNITVINNGIPPIKEISFHPNFPLPQGEGQSLPPKYLSGGEGGGVSGCKQISLSSTMDKKIVDFCKEGFIVGAIGRLSYEKGFNFLIEAVNILKKKSGKIKLVIIGEGYERDHLNDLAASVGCSDSILMPGYKANASAYLPLFDVFVLSSLTEGLPIVILEAMQYGVPIVATRVGGVPAVLEEGRAGVLVESANVMAIADGIGIVKNVEYSRSLVMCAKEIVTSRYTSGTMAADYRKIYRMITPHF